MTLPRTALATLLLLCSACDSPADDSSPEAVPADAAMVAAGGAGEAAPVPEGDAAEIVDAAASAAPIEGDAPATEADTAADPTAAAAVDEPAAGTDAPDAEAGVADVPSALAKKALACPGIDSATSHLVGAEDRAAAAKSQGLSMVEGRVRLIAELTSADADLEGPVEEELRAGTSAQVLIQPDSICAFAATKGVKRVRKPEAPRPK